ncbi:MAG: ankyrin repeat domain-containing protein, partial [Longimicrobiales bacterium]
MSSTDIQQPDLERAAGGQPLRFHHRAATVLAARIAAGTMAAPFLITLVTGTRGGFALLALVLLFAGAWLAVHVHRRAAVRPEAVSVDQDGITLHGPGPAHRLAWKHVAVLYHRRLRMTVRLGTRGDPEAMTFDADLDDFRGFLEAVTMHLTREVTAPDDPDAPAARGGDARAADARAQSLFRRSIGEDIVTFAASAAGIVLGLFAQPAYFLIAMIALPRLTWHWLTAPHSAVIDDTAVWIIRPLARDVIPLRAIRTATLGTASLPVAPAIVIDHRDRGTLLIRGFGAATLPLFTALTTAMRRDRAAPQTPSGVRRTSSSVQIAGLSRSVMLTTAAAMLGLIGIAWLTILTGVPLRTATIHGSELIARSTLLLGGRPGSADRDGFTALHHAAARNDTAIAGALIRGGSDADARSRLDGVTPLHLAAEGGHHAVVELLVGAGADVDSRSTAGRTPLSYAASGERGDTDVGRMLLNEGADPDAADDEGRTTVHHAAAAGHGPLLQLLARAGANLETADSGGHRPLHAAVMTNRQD